MSNAADDTAGPPAPPGILLPRRSLVANTLYAVGGTGFYHACQLGVLVLLAKFASPEIQGQYLLGLAIATPALLLFGFELRGALVADAGNQFSVGSYVALRWTMMVPAAAVLAGCLAWAGRDEPSGAYLLILAGVFLMRIIWSLAEVGWGTFQRRERLDLLAASMGLRGLALILPLIALLPAYDRFATGWPAADRTAAAVWLCVLGSVLVLLLFERPRVLDRRLWDLSWSWPGLRALALQTLPLGLVAVTISLCDNFPRLLFESEWVPHGKAQLGYFGSLAYITLAGNLVISQAATAAANRLSIYYRNDVRAFLRLGAGLASAALIIGAVVIVVALLFGRWILTALYTPEYGQFESAFHVIVFAHCIALLTTVFGFATTQMRLFWVQVPVQGLTLLATVIAAILLIPGQTPVFGAAQTALVRAVVQFVLYAGCVGLGLRFRQRVLSAVK